MSHKASFFPAPPPPGKQKKVKIRLDSRARERAPYSALAASYDALMGHVDFPGWARYLYRVREELQSKPCQSLVDLGCGTGQLLHALGTLLPGCRLEGLDRSEQMLRLARQILPRARFSRSDLRHLRGLKGPYDWLVSSHDALNYLIEPSDLARHFRSVARMMGPDSLYSFDLVCEENILAHFAGQGGDELLDGVKIGYSHEYDSASRLLRSRMRIDCQERTEEEIHWQRFYSRKEIDTLLAQAGLRIKNTGHSYGRHQEIPDFINYHVVYDPGT